MFVEKFTNIAKSKKATAVTALFSAIAIFAEADHSYNHSRLSDSLSGVARFIMDHGSSLYPFISVSALGLAEFAIKNRTFRKYVPFLALYSTIAFTGSFLISEFEDIKKGPCITDELVCQRKDLPLDLPDIGINFVAGGVAIAMLANKAIEANPNATK